MAGRLCVVAPGRGRAGGVDQGGDGPTVDDVAGGGELGTKAKTQNRSIGWEREDLEAEQPGER